MRNKKINRSQTVTEFLLDKARQAFNQGIEARVRLMDYLSGRSGGLFS